MKANRQLAGLFLFSALAGGLWTLPIASHAAAYSFTDLNPTRFTGSYGYGICGNQQVGEGYGAPTGKSLHALLWNGGASENVDLNPNGIDASGAVAVYGNTQVGAGNGPATGESFPHALLWTGNDHTVVDLNPNGFIYTYATSVFDSQQVGAGYGPATGNYYHALLWTGTPTSVVDLNPAGITETHCNGTSGTHQIGFGVATGGRDHALLWAGSARSVIDLNPAGFISSYGMGISGSYQVGLGLSPAKGGGERALLWAGTPESATDLNPTGFTGSVAKAISGSNLVGSAWGPAGGYLRHALLWSGLGTSIVDLQTFLSSDYDQSEANGIDAHGNIIGTANYVATGQPHAIRWSPLPDPVVICNDSNQCGAVWTFCTGPGITCNPPSGSFFPVGTSIVTCTATSPSGISANHYLFTITVKDCEPPAVSCRVLDDSRAKDGSWQGKHSGQDLYQLFASDNCDPYPQLFILDSTTGQSAGPFKNGVIVKITRSKDRRNDSRGPDNADGTRVLIAAHIHLQAGGLLYAVDASGNIAAATDADSLFGQEITRVVTTLDDNGPGSLRNQIGSAHAGDMISFAVRGTIVLTNGELLLNKNLSIAGPGATDLAISANRQSRVLNIAPGVGVSLSDLTICDGRAPEGAVGTSNNPAGGHGGNGGGIYNAGSLVLAQCVISNCAAGDGGAGYLAMNFGTPGATNWCGGAGGRGGALFNLGKLSLIGSLLISNDSGAGGYAGGTREFGAAGSLGGGGGAVYSAGKLTLTSCTFDYNAAGNGGAGYSGYFASLRTSVDGGRAGGAGGNGGAVCDAGEVATTIADCHFHFNTSGAGAMGTTCSFYYDVVLGGSGGSGGGGGAIWAKGATRMNGCTFLSNQTGGGGPGGLGIQTSGAGGVGGPGGAICAIGELNLSRCSYASNQAGWGGEGGRTYYSGQGGGSGGSGGSGGAVYAANALRLNDCIFTDNLAGAGGQGASTSDTSYLDPRPGGGGTGGSGGALFCQSDLRASNSALSRNRAGNAGRPGFAGFNASFSSQPTTSGSDGGQAGGIFCAGPIVLRGCTLSGNVGGNGSSADTPSKSFVGATISLTALNSGGLPGSNPHPQVHSYTRVGGPGGAGGTGGVHSQNTLKMVLCTLNGNVGGTGGDGGSSSGGYMQYRTGGTAGAGGPGAICCLSSNGLDLVACTIAANRAGSGGIGGSGSAPPNGSGTTGQGSGGVGGAGGLFNGNTNPAVLVKVINTIVAANVGGAGGAGGPYPRSYGENGAPDVQGSFVSLGHNLISQTDRSSGFTNGVNGDLAGSGAAPIAPVLGPLTDNGGPTYTMALLHGSPALDAGDDALLRPPYVVKTDQRGFPRKSGSHVDIGAFEFQIHGGDAHAPAPAPTLSGAYSSSGSNMASEVSADSAPTAAPCYQLSFSDNTPGATFTVLATTNLSLPLDNWSVIGQAPQTFPGLFQFTDLHATNNPQRFYRVSSP